MEYKIQLYPFPKWRNVVSYPTNLKGMKHLKLFPVPEYVSISLRNRPKKHVCTVLQWCSTKILRRTNTPLRLSYSLQLSVLKIDLTIKGITIYFSTTWSLYLIMLTMQVSDSSIWELPPVPHLCTRTKAGCSQQNSCIFLPYRSHIWVNDFYLCVRFRVYW